MFIRLLTLLTSFAATSWAASGQRDDPHSAQNAVLPLVVAAAQDRILSKGREIHVAPHGSDDNSGDRSAPLRTIAKAARMATPGSTVYVAPGLYFGGFQTSVSGTPSARIRFVATARWAAKIIPNRGSTADIAWDNRGDYVSIEGFEVDGSGNARWRIGIYGGGSSNTIAGNHVHHIANQAACTSNGGAGINIDSYYGGKQSHVAGNVVHHIGRPKCQFIHGVYVSTSGTVKNNLVYQIGAAAIHLWHDASSVTIAHNTVFASQYGLVVGGGDYYHTRGPADNITVANNIFFDNAYGMVEEGDIGKANAYLNNLTFKNTKAETRLITRDYGTIRSDPEFINYLRSGGGNYRLRPTSPANAKGIAAYRTEHDIEGIIRGQNPDIGAFESVTK